MNISITKLQYVLRELPPVDSVKYTYYRLPIPSYNDIHYHIPLVDCNKSVHNDIRYVALFKKRKIRFGNSCWEEWELVDWPEGA